MILGRLLIFKLELRNTHETLCFPLFLLLFCVASFLGYDAAAQDPAANPAPASGPALTNPVPAADQPGVTETISPEILQFQKIEDSWSDAVNRRDQYSLELVLSPLFVDVTQRAVM